MIYFVSILSNQWTDVLKVRTKSNKKKIPKKKKFFILFSLLTKISLWYKSIHIVYVPLFVFCLWSMFRKLTFGSRFSSSAFLLIFICLFRSFLSSSSSSSISLLWYIRRNKNYDTGSEYVYAFDFLSLSLNQCTVWIRMDSLDYTNEFDRSLACYWNETKHNFSAVVSWCATYCFVKSIFCIETIFIRWNLFRISNLGNFFLLCSHTLPCLSLIVSSENNKFFFLLKIVAYQKLLHAV